MAKMSKSEQRFREKYPHTRVEVEPYSRSMPRVKVFQIYAGDYPCGRSISRAQAFKDSLELACGGYITPDPEERSTKVSA